MAQAATEDLFVDGNLRETPEALARATTHVADLERRLYALRPHDPYADDRARIRTAVDKARFVIDQEFPGYWPRVEANLAAAATLRLESLDNCIALITVGSPGTGKSTALVMFFSGLGVERKDDFTHASFVAHTMGKTEEELEKIDLLPKIKHKIMVTSELSPLLRGSTDQLTERFKIFTSVLDGKGMSRTTAAHGERKVTGDYVFVWLGGSTPLQQRTWDVAANLGNRFLFYSVDAGQLTADDIMLRRQGRPYKEKVDICNAAVKDALVALLSRPDGPPTACDAVRSVKWGKDPEHVTRWLVNLGMLLARSRYKRPKRDLLGSDTDDGGGQEDPSRNITLLENIARGRAMTCGRRVLDITDLALPTHITFSSMPGTTGRLLRAVVKHHGTGLSAAEAARECDISHPTAEHYLKTLSDRGDLVELAPWRGPVTHGHAKDALYLTKDWEWMKELKPWL